MCIGELDRAKASTPNKARCIHVLRNTERLEAVAVHEGKSNEVEGKSSACVLLCGSAGRGKKKKNRDTVKVRVSYDYATETREGYKERLSMSLYTGTLDRGKTVTTTSTQGETDLRTLGTPRGLEPAMQRTKGGEETRFIEKNEA